MDKLDKTLPDFSLSLALVDALPVIFFFLSSLSIAKELKKIHSLGGLLFNIGGILAYLGGFFQVLWKLIIALFNKDIYIFHSQIKYLLPLGFIFIIISLIVSHSTINWKKLITKLLSMPCLIFVVIIMFCNLLMISFLFTMNQLNTKSHWKEECVNVIFQGSFLICTHIASKNEINRKENKQK